MVRYGKLTGQIYDENIKFSECPECCGIIPQDIENNKEQIAKYISEQRVKDLLTCMGCFDCPASESTRV